MLLEPRISLARQAATCGARGGEADRGHVGRSTRVGPGVWEEFQTLAAGSDPLRQE